MIKDDRIIADRTNMIMILVIAIVKLLIIMGITRKMICSKWQMSVQIKIESIQIICFLTHLISFYILCKHQKISGFVMFSGDIERDQ